MQYYETTKCPENRIVKGAIVKQPKGVYSIQRLYLSELPEALPSGRIMGVVYNHCRELKGKNGNTFYHPYDVKEVLIDFGWLGKVICHPANIVISDGQMVCLTHARPMP